MENGITCSSKKAKQWKYTLFATAGAVGEEEANWDNLNMQLLAQVISNNRFPWILLESSFTTGCLEPIVPRKYFATFALVEHLRMKDKRLIYCGA